MSPQLFTDADVLRHLTMPLAVERMEEAFRLHAVGTSIAPAAHHERVGKLSSIIGDAWRRTAQEVTLFYSLGLAGTEALLADLPWSRASAGELGNQS